MLEKIKIYYQYLIPFTHINLIIWDPFKSLKLESQVIQTIYKIKFILIFPLRLNSTLLGVDLRHFFQLKEVHRMDPLFFEKYTTNLIKLFFC